MISEFETVSRVVATYIFAKPRESLVGSLNRYQGQQQLTNCTAKGRLAHQLEEQPINRENSNLQAAQPEVGFEMVSGNSHSQPAKLRASFFSRLEMVPGTTETHKLQCQE